MCDSWCVPSLRLGIDSGHWCVTREVSRQDNETLKPRKQTCLSAVILKILLRPDALCNDPRRNARGVATKAAAIALHQSLLGLCDLKACAESSCGPATPLSSSISANTSSNPPTEHGLQNAIPSGLLKVASAWLQLLSVARHSPTSKQSGIVCSLSRTSLHHTRFLQQAT